MDNNLIRKDQLYLGKVVSEGKLGEPFFLKTSDLTTHAICIGMTGSGKTGLCIDLLEELALNGVPIIIIDPKGDLCNLAFQFPDLAPEDYLPIINESQAEAEGVTKEVYAEKIAKRWREGLLNWGIDKERILKLKERSELRIFTPGSRGGTPLNLLSDLNKDSSLDFDIDSEAIFEKIKGLTLALLNLIGFEDIDLTDKNYLLLLNIFEWCWKNDESLDLVKLIKYIITPPFSKLGVMDIESIFSKDKREDFAIKINALIANPSFKVWLEGFPMEIKKLLKTESGKPSISIIYTAHLKKNEKMFVTTILLYNIISWMHSQSGSGRLRAYLYFDEVFGYLPPYPKNPPTKEPLLTLLKQARAFGLGVHLTSQNPMDIDYKAFTNAGVWMIGKLQTENDKERLLDGLKKETDIDDTSNKTISSQISRLRKREFIIKNIHTEKIEIVNSRWAISYLKGPLTLRDIKNLKMKSDEPVNQIKHKVSETTESGDLIHIRPNVNSAIEHKYLSAAPDEGKDIFYYPDLYFKVKVIFDSKRPLIFEQKEFLVTVDASKDSDFSAFEFSLNASIDEGTAIQEYPYYPLSDKLKKAAFVKVLKSQVNSDLIKNHSIEIFKNRPLKLFSKPGQTIEDFKLLIDSEIEDKIDEKIQKIKSTYLKKLQRLEINLRKKLGELISDKEDLESRKKEEGFSALESVFSVFSGRKRRSILSQASRKRRMTKKAAAEVKQTTNEIAIITDQIKRVKEELEDKIAGFEDQFDIYRDVIETILIKPKKTNIIYKEIFILWKPRKINE